MAALCAAIVVVPAASFLASAPTSGVVSLPSGHALTGALHAGTAQSVGGRAGTRAVAPAATELGWKNISNESSTALPTFWFTEGTWDAQSQQILYYGGDNDAGTNLATTEAYSNGTWSNVTTTGADPGPLDGPSLAYDPPAGVVVMYGGVASYSPFEFTNLTYTYSDGAWTSASLPSAPPGRTAAGMVYDPSLGGVVMFGGYNNSDPSGTVGLNDLWLYQDGAWSQIPDSSPPSDRAWSPLAYDPALGAIVTFGGLAPSTGLCLGDTWTYNGTWSRISASIGPLGELCGAELAYDPTLGEVVLTGGFNNTAVSNLGAFAFNGTAWSPLPAAAPLPEHDYGVSVWDPSQSMLVVAGGIIEVGGSYTDVLSAPLAFTNVTSPGEAETGESVPFAAAVVGGTPVRGAVHWDWGDGTPPTTGDAVVHTFAEAGNYTVRLTAADPAGEFAEWNVTVNVTLGLAASFTPRVSVVDANVSLQFQATSAHGLGAVTFAWQFGDGASGAGPMVEHEYSVAGPVTISLVATDSAGVQAVVYQRIDVEPALSVEVKGALAADVGSPSSLAAVVDGGDPPYTYQWSVDNAGPSTGMGFTHVYSAAGPQSVLLTVGDATGNNVTVVEAVTVNPSLAVQLEGPTSLTIGTTGTWTAAISGGTAPFNVSWSVAGGATGAGVRAALAFATAGTYVLTFHTADSAGASNNSSVRVAVSSGPSLFGGTIAGIPTLPLVIGLVAAVVVIASVVVLMLRRHRTRPPS